MLSRILLFAIFLVSIPYFILSLVAYRHTINGDRDAKLTAISPYWALNEKIYDDTGKKLCSYGKMIMVIDVVLGIAWLIVQ